MKQEKRKVIILNSGGYDSVCLAHKVRYELEPEAEVHSLFFFYGQVCEGREQECARRVSQKLGFTHEEYRINFDWGDNALTGAVSNESVYVPMRNLIFLSYALSYAERVGADAIYCAFVYEYGEYYKDTSPQFVEKINKIAESIGVEVKAPFIYTTKEDALLACARKYGISRGDFHSCNHSNEKGGCGKCTDCRVLNKVFDEIESKLPEDILINNNFWLLNPDFINSIKVSPMNTLKLYINNGCQFDCAHCFIGHQKLMRNQLSLNQWKGIIQEAKRLGIKHIDFFGKEPLINDKVFYLIKECGNEISTSIITNGVGVPPFITQIAESGASVTVSVESVKKVTQFRNTGEHILKVLERLVNRDISTSVSVDLSPSNYGNLNSIFRECAKCGVKQFYVKPVRPFGAHEHYLMDKILPSRKLIDVVKVLDKLSLKYDVDVTYALASMDIHRMYVEHKEYFFEVFGEYLNDRQKFTEHGVVLDLELYCQRFQNMAAITPDGYVLGCASEYAQKDYTKNAYDLVELGLEECLRLGKESLCSNNYKDIGCYFCKEYCKKDHKILEVG